MSARLLALCCLWILVASPASAGSNLSTAAGVVVYLKTQSDQPAAPLEHMKRELAALMRSPGYRVEWRDPESANRNVDDAELVVVELRGSCGIPAGLLATSAPGSGLASSYVSGAKVMPFSWLDCAALSRFIAPSLAIEPAAQRDLLYGRAMARLLAHELYHVIANTRDHSREGIGKSGFTVKDLLSDHFEFAAAALARLAR